MRSLRTRRWRTNLTTAENGPPVCAAQLEFRRSVIAFYDAKYNLQFLATGDRVRAAATDGTRKPRPIPIGFRGRNDDS